METILLYFFSTLAQSFAALVAFVFAVSQFRISWLDTKITSLKKVALYSTFGASIYSDAQIDFKMNKYSATQVADFAKKKNNTDCEEVAKKLAEQIIEIQVFRKGIRNHIVWGILFIMIGIAGIPMSFYLKSVEGFSMVLMLLITILVIWCCCKMGYFIYESLKVSLTKSLS